VAGCGAFRFPRAESIARMALWSQNMWLQRTANCRTLSLSDNRKGYVFMPVKMERLEARVSRDQKIRLMQAAELEGSTLTDFIVRAAQEAANKTLERMEVLKLTARDRETFVNALIMAPPPSPRLRQAAARYKKILSKAK
jgi:uncharacterized protein (DUF1778 family)